MEAGKESISSVLEESIFLEKVNAGGVVEKESFVVAAVWEICAYEEEGQEKENVAFWWVVGRDSSSVYH